MSLFSTIANTPELHQEFDVFRIFTYIARELGAKNVDDFKRVAGETNVQTQPDATVAKEVDKGNLVAL